MASGKESDGDSKHASGRFEGSPGELDDFDKKVGRWCRKKYGTELGNKFWVNDMPDLGALHGESFRIYCELVWDSIDDSNSTQAKGLYPMDSGFWDKKWQKKWIRKQFDRIFDKVESLCTGAAGLEVQTLGMENAPELRAHLHRQFGGSGDDVRAREEKFEGALGGFPRGCDMEVKLRELQAERVALFKMCKPSKRVDYEYGSSVKLVKIVLKALKGTDYKPVVDSLIQEIKIKRNLEMRLPVANPMTGVLELPTGKTNGEVIGDWDYRNYNDDWLPTWGDLKSKLISAYKDAVFAKEAVVKTGSRQGHQGKQIPSMLNPGFGTSPKVVQCFGCGEYGHRRGDPVCKAGPNAWSDNAPAKYKAKITGNRGGGNGSGTGVDNFRKKRNDLICYSFRDTGKCKFGSNCKFKHADGPPTKKVKLTKTQKKSVTVAAVKTLSAKLKQKAQERDGKDLDESELQTYLAGLMFVKTIPRECVEILDVEVPAMATSSLLNMERHVCYDSGSGTGITTDPDDMVYVDDSKEAKSSVRIKGPSVGSPGCDGRGPLVYRRVINNIHYGVIHPDRVLAKSSIGFRIASERLLGNGGLRFIGGKYNKGCKLQCVKTNVEVPMATEDNILVLETNKRASEVVDSPKFRAVVDEVRRGVRSPLVELTPFLPGEKRKVKEVNGNGRYAATMSPASFLAKVLCLTVVAMAINPTMIFNEAKALPEERSRLYVRRLGYCSSRLFKHMAKMPEYAGFPDLPELNEDNLVQDLAKFTRKSYPKNDPESAMSCPPWWRVYCDGYGGQESLGGESYEGAVGGYLFVCVSTGSADIRFYSSHKQFPIALHQFLCRVEAEHFRCHVIYVDTFSVNLSVEAEEVVALFKCVINPVSAGTPQEMAYAESMVRTVKRRSTAMMQGAPHLGPEYWGLCDKYAVYLHDFLPISSRKFSCPYFLRTGKVVPWDILCIHNMGAPLVYAPMDGPVHKRGAMSEEGWYVGIQWPAALVKRKSDGKVLNVSRKKIHVYEASYLAPLDQRVPHDKDGPIDFSKEELRSGVYDTAVQEGGSSEVELQPQMNKNMVQSIKSLREHRYLLPGDSNAQRPETELDKSAAAESQFGGEGVYVDDICNQTEFAKLTDLLEQAIAAVEKGVSKPSIRSQVISKIKSATDLTLYSAGDKGRLKVGKKSKIAPVSNDNVIEGRRSRKKVKFSQDDSSSSSSVAPTTPIDSLSKKDGRGAPKKICEGDVVSLPAEAFDGDDPGSWSDDNPGICYGIVESVSKAGVAKVRWLEEDKVDEVKVKDLSIVRNGGLHSTKQPKRATEFDVNVLKLEKQKFTCARVIVMLVEGTRATFVNPDEETCPKNFFEVLVKSNWRKWVQAVKDELEGWDNNNAVTVVPMMDVPAGAKVVPLGELYTRKRDGRFKYRQYLMGNLLREGVDYSDTFSATVSAAGICTFYSLATTCDKMVWSWDAVCGYLQVKEQYDIFAFLPSHHEYSRLEYEELATLREEFLNLVKKEGPEGLRKFASKHKRHNRSNPDNVFKCNSSIYGGPSCGHEFEMLIHAVHTKTAGCTQTQPEPSMYVRIVVDKEDKVVGYLIAAAYVDDVIFFGTDPERLKYMGDVRSKIKVKFEEPPVKEFVAIEIEQDMEHHTCELKMPKYWKKAAAGFAHLFPTGMKERGVPMTNYDEKILQVDPTDAEIQEARDLPYREILGVMSFPVSMCKFEMKYAISVLGSRRGGWSAKHFGVVLKVFEYGVHTCDIGLMYSKGLDPRGENTLYAYADASLKVPRSYGCRIVMMNGAALSLRAKKHISTDSSSCASEMTELFYGCIDVKGLRNLMAELGMYQVRPTWVYQDNESTIKIANNRGSLGVSSRAMDLQTLRVRNMVEDHIVETKQRPTDRMVADMGTKSLPEGQFTLYRDVMNGYALVKAAYPNKRLSPLVFGGDASSVTAALVSMQVLVKEMGTYLSADQL